MKIELRKELLLIKKHKSSKYSVDMSISEDDGDKTLITGEVLNDGSLYKKGTTVIFGKYAVLELLLQGEVFHILEEEDVLGTADYKENV